MLNLSTFELILLFVNAILIFSIIYAIRLARKNAIAVAGFRAKSNKVEITDELIARWKSEAAKYSAISPKGSAYRKALTEVGRPFVD